MQWQTSCRAHCFSTIAQGVAHNLVLHISRQDVRIAQSLQKQCRCSSTAGGACFSMHRLKRFYFDGTPTTEIPVGPLTVRLRSMSNTT